MRTSASASTTTRPHAALIFIFNSGNDVKQRDVSSLITFHPTNLGRKSAEPQ
jgi:hypothetical protein